ncbi:lipoprotein [Spiroplasma sp. SV19]|uniref:lipoprotein n=1 Tax=Spiroplasma sp. SV19 TaxID=2570468 RepID=UPI0024B64E28|nr:lipoprotein [Spiroplasma sp. SV19]WHQ36964.1 hypothetical protein E7Y35_03580 [Spiroplasma sp. SV19]
MKKLLTVLTSVSLLAPTVNTIISCNSKPKHVPDDDAGQGVNDVDIINKIMTKVSERFKAWWDKKATIDINIYPDQITKFQELVTRLKTNDGEVLTGNAINQYRFLDQLVTGFKAEFDNLNREIANEYSNFYLGTVPLSVEPDDIAFMLSHINFDNLAKLMTVNDKSIMGITINFKISYQIKFKDFEQRNSTEGFVVICNDVEALSGIQKNLENYFITFIDELFKKENYQVIDKVNRSYNNIDSSNTIWPVIVKELTERGILFKGRCAWSSFYSTMTLTHNLVKAHSVLRWAGEGYDPEKLTSEKFLQFYKNQYFNATTLSDYYVKGNIASFVPSSLTIENLPFNNKNTYKSLKTPIKVLIAKEYTDQDLIQFAEITMKLWQYYQIETYNDKLVFKVNQDDFDNLIKTTASFSEDKSISANLSPVFRKVFNIFEGTLSSRTNWNTNIYILTYSDLKQKVNLVKDQKSFVFHLLRKQDPSGSYVPMYINFSYNSFAYSFFFKPSDKETNTDKSDEFLQTIEFKVV